MSSHHLKAKPPRPDSISHCISPVASAWNMNRPDDPAEPEADPLDAVMSGFALNAIERSEYSTSRHDVERKERTNVEGIAMMERRYRWPSFLHYFRDVQREREYERWYWKRNRRAWIRSVGYMLAAALCYYAQFLIVGPIQAQSFREKREKDPDAICGSYTYCRISYSPVADIVFLLVGNAMPILLILTIVHCAPAISIASMVHVLSCLLGLILMLINFVIRNLVVDPEGDSWFRAVLCMGIIFYPMMMKMSALLTLICCSVVVTCYGVLFRRFIQSSDPAIASSQGVMLVYMVLCVILSVHLMSQFESSERRAFAINLGLVRNNDKLRHQLNHLQRKFKHKVNDLDSPLEKALWTLKSLLANPNLDMITHQQIDATIEWLSASENLFTPILDRHNAGERMSLDDEQEKWLLDLLPAQQRRDDLKKRRKRAESENSTIGTPHIPGSIIVQDDSDSSAIRPLSARAGSVIQPDARNNSLRNPAIENFLQSSRLSLSVLTPVGGSANSLSTISLGRDVVPEGNSEPTPIASEHTILLQPSQPSPIQISLSTDSSTNVVQTASTNTAVTSISEANRVAIQSLLSDVGQWNWKIFEFELLAPKPLYTLGLYLFHRAGLVGKFSVPMDKLRHFLLRIEAGYHPDVPYHNSTHACDVLHATNYFVNTAALQGRLTDIEIFGAYLSAIIHDYDHPGFNNQFLVSTKHSKAIFYNDRSVLENHHLASAWSIVIKDESNILCNLSKEEYKMVREQCVDMVLATDLSGHFAMLSAFKNKVFAAGTFDLDNRDDRSLFWRILIKCADVSNLTKEWCIYERWLERIMAEFFRQGDDEKKLGIPVSPFMDRDTVQVASSQISFLDFICLPMYETFTRVAQIPDVLETLARNRDTLVGMREKNKV